MPFALISFASFKTACLAESVTNLDLRLSEEDLSHDWHKLVILLLCFRDRRFCAPFTEPIAYTRQEQAASSTHADLTACRTNCLFRIVHHPTALLIV